MNKLLLAGASLIALTLQVAAADMPPAPVAEEAIVEPGDWSGFYAGLNVGYAWQASDGGIEVTIDGVPYTDPLDDLEAEGFFGGAQAGFNHQIDSFVLGIEADIQAADISDDVEGFGNGAEIDEYSASIDLNWFGTLRGRVGVAFENTLLYATGGLAFGGVDFEFSSEDDAGNLTDISSDDIEVGFVVGGGVEHKFSESWSVKAEYQYIDFGEIEASGFEAGTGDPVSAELDLSLHTARIGLNYHF